MNRLLRRLRHKTGFRLGMAVLALCWLLLSLAITCQRALPQNVPAGSDTCVAMAGMAANEADSAPSPFEGCGGEPCFEALPDHGVQFQALFPHGANFLLPSIALIIRASRSLRSAISALPIGPPSAAIPLYYRYCSLRD